MLTKTMRRSYRNLVADHEKTLKTCNERISSQEKALVELILEANNLREASKSLQEDNAILSKSCETLKKEASSSLGKAKDEEEARLRAEAELEKLKTEVGDLRSRAKAAAAKEEENVKLREEISLLKQYQSVINEKLSGCMNSVNHVFAQVGARP